MKNGISIAFYIKAEKAKIGGDAPTYAKVNCDGSQTTIATRKYVSKGKWKSTKQLKLARNEEDIYLRNDLNDMRRKLLEIYLELSKEGKQVTAQLVKTEYLNPGKKSLEIVHTLSELFKIHNQKFWSRVEIGKRSPESYKKHVAVQYHIIEFLKEYRNTTDFELKNLSLEFMESFELYLRSRKKISNNTTMKYCQFFVSMINTGIKKGLLEKNPFKGFEYEFEETETNFLTEKQLCELIAMDFECERLNVVKDIFVFTCLTSYAPIDARKLTYNNIIQNIDGQNWIMTRRSKTDITSNVPVLPYVQNLIDKYITHPDCIAHGTLLPFRSNAKMNLYLKEIGVALKLPFELHYYVGRHSFGTLMISWGVSMESVSKMMGHKRLIQTQHYAKVVENKVGVLLIFVCNLAYEFNRNQYDIK
jgi:site-specific recombinase XerD